MDGQFVIEHENILNQATRRDIEALKGRNERLTNRVDALESRVAENERFTIRTRATVQAVIAILSVLLSALTAASLFMRIFG